MSADYIRQTINTTPRLMLPQVASLLWNCFALGQISDEEATQLSDLIEKRKAPLPLPRKPPVGSRPRTPESLLRRRRWTAAGRLPPQIACQFTMGETAVLALVAAEVAKRGDCRLTIGNIAAVAGVSLSTARNALRTARLLGLLTSELRRVARRRNDSNIIRIISPEWCTWLRLKPRKTEGVNFQRARIPDNKKAPDRPYSQAAMNPKMGPSLLNLDFKERALEPKEMARRHLHHQPRRINNG